MTDAELVSAFSMLDREPEPETTVGPFSVFRLRPLVQNHRVQPSSPSESFNCEDSWPTPDDECVSDQLGGPEHAVATPPDVSDSNRLTLPMKHSELTSQVEKSPSLPTSDTTDSEEFYSIDDRQQTPDDLTYHGNCIGYDEMDESSDIMQLCGDSEALIMSHHNSVDLQRQGFIDRLERGAAFQGDGVRDVHFMPFQIPLYNMATPIAGSSSVAIFIHHYAEHVAHLMQPVAHQNNPFRSLYLPLAIEGSFDMGDYQALGSIMSARAAVFHSLVATSALHLLGLGLKNPDLERLICHHKQQALVALRFALSKKVSKYKELMMGVLSLVSVDVSPLLHHGFEKKG